MKNEREARGRIRRVFETRRTSKSIAVIAVGIGLLIGVSLEMHGAKKGTKYSDQANELTYNYPAPQKHNREVNATRTFREKNPNMEQKIAALFDSSKRTDSTAFYWGDWWDMSQCETMARGVSRDLYTQIGGIRSVIVESKLMYMEKLSTASGDLLLTCSAPDRKLTMTLTKPIRSQ